MPVDIWKRVLRNWNLLLSFIVFLSITNFPSGFYVSALYADLSRIPSLLPSQRSEEQTKHAYKMLSDCFRYPSIVSSWSVELLIILFYKSYQLFLLNLKNVFMISTIICRYGMATASCRAKTLVKYFGEDFRYDKCLLYAILSASIQLPCCYSWMNFFCYIPKYPVCATVHIWAKS